MDDAARLEEYPRQYARTRRFTLGAPRDFIVSPDGSRVVFLRTKGPVDTVSCLWVLDVASGEERCVFDPRDVGGVGEDEDLSQAEKDRRERVGESTSGVTGYSADRDVRIVVFAVSGHPHVADLQIGEIDDLSVPGSVDDPRIDPTGRRVAYVVGGALHVRDLEGGNRVLAADADPDTSWGLPEFIAAEEMHRLRGHWWSPDGRLLAATRVDRSDVTTWYLHDPGDPAQAPRPIRFPPAGTANATVELWVFDVATGGRVEVGWDRDAFPYLARVLWSEGAPLTLLVQSRDQRRAQLLEIDAATGHAAVVREYTDDAWLDLPEDAPVRLKDGRVVTVEVDAATDTKRLTVDGEAVTPPGLQVRGVLEAGDDVLFRASEEPTELHVWRWSADGSAVRLSHDPGVHHGTGGGDVLVLTSSTLDDPLPATTVLKDSEPLRTIATLVERPVVEPRPILLTLGARELRAALLLPGGREPDEPLPVLLDPYGGPGPLTNRVWHTMGAYLTSQWFADQGFAVLVVDGRGMDGRGPAWEREIRHDFPLTLEDQVDALHAAADRFPFLDTSRVAMRGWSFGGYLSALAVLRRPDVFRAAIVGAPVTDFRLYDTHYTERYLGDPNELPEVYEHNAFVHEAANLTRPILLIHGLTDDNVVPAHTMRFSAALFEAGRFHELVLLPGAHRTGSDAVAANQLLVQLDFLKRTLGVG